MKKTQERRVAIRRRVLNIREHLYRLVPSIEIDIQKPDGSRERGVADHVVLRLNQQAKLCEVYVASERGQYCEIHAKVLAVVGLDYERTLLLMGYSVAMR